MTDRELLERKNIELDSMNELKDLVDFTYMSFIKHQKTLPLEARERMQEFFTAYSEIKQRLAMDIRELDGKEFTRTFSEKFTEDEKRIQKRLAEFTEDEKRLSEFVDVEKSVNEHIAKMQSIIFEQDDIFTISVTNVVVD